MIELALAARRPSTSAAVLPAARSCRSATARSTPLLEREPALRDADLVVVHGADRQRSCTPAAWATSTRRWTFRGARRALRAAVAGRQRDPPRGARHRRARRARAAEPVEFDGPDVHRGRLGDADRAAGSPRNVIPDDVRRAHVNFRYAPGRARRGGRGAAARADATAHGELEIDGNAPSAAPVAARQPARAAADRGRRRSTRAQAGLDAGGRVRRRGRRRRQLRPGRARAGAPPRRVDRDRQPRARATGPGGVRCAAEPRPRRPAARTRSCGSTRPSAASRPRGSSSSTSGMGEPREETPAFIREALAGGDRAGRRPTRRRTGCPSCAQAIAGWAGRRFGAALDPDTRDRADARLQGGRSSPSRRSSAATRSRSRRPATRSPSAARCSPGARCSSCRCWRPTASCPTSTRAPRPGRASALLWLNYPNNPTGARSRRSSCYERAAALAREHDFVLASDEAYSELYFGGDAPASRAAAAPTARTSSCSTRSPSARRCPATGPGSSPATRRSIAALKRYRPNVGVAPQEFVQRASVAAWDDEAHVEAVRDALPRQARGPAAGAARRPACARGRRRRRSSCGCDAGRRGRRGLRRAAARGGRRRARPARSSAPAATGYVRFALVPPPEVDARARRARLASA